MYKKKWRFCRLPRTFCQSLIGGIEAILVYVSYSLLYKKLYERKLHKNIFYLLLYFMHTAISVALDFMTMLSADITALP